MPDVIYDIYVMFEKDIDDLSLALENVSVEKVDSNKNVNKIIICIVFH